MTCLSGRSSAMAGESRYRGLNNGHRGIRTPPGQIRLATANAVLQAAFAIACKKNQRVTLTSLAATPLMGSVVGGEACWLEEIG